jgi:hypothetical protein
MLFFGISHLFTLVFMEILLNLYTETESILCLMFNNIAVKNNKLFENNVRTFSRIN